MITNPSAFARVLRSVPGRRALILCVVLFLTLCTFGLAFSATGDEPAFIAFDPPDSTYTYPTSINSEGTITGSYTDTFHPYHGFVRDRDGTITTFDAPDAGKVLAPGTQSLSINEKGTITGWYWDASGVEHGFLRERNGEITEFDAPGAALTSGSGTQPNSINAEGVIAGLYADANTNSFRGFLRGPDGTFTEFDASSSTHLTEPAGINSKGAIAGRYWASDTIGYLGFLRAPDGTITTFDIPGLQGPSPVAINPEDAIAGWDYDLTGWHSFLREPDGKITQFDAPDARTDGWKETVATGINSKGAIIGWYFDEKEAKHGFLREPNGEITDFTAPGAIENGPLSVGTQPNAINPEGVIVGQYCDTKGCHGFVLRLKKP